MAGVATYRWGARESFVNRSADLAQLDSWWEHPTRDAMALVGRRRVGKSWLFRRFADGKPAVVLVADQRLLTTQMARFAAQLEAVLGFRPDLPDVPALFRLLYELGRDKRVLAVIDEFPFLLPEGSARSEVLSAIQAVMEEERDESRTKILLCGSLIGQMESLLHASSPLHGRLRPMDVVPMGFADGRHLTDSRDSPEERITRYAAVGGMARYLQELGHGPLPEVMCDHVLAPRSPLFNDPRAVLEQELKSPATYFSILEELSKRPAQTPHLTNRLGLGAQELAPYLQRLRAMRLIETVRPLGAPATGRSSQHRVSDGFVRFWFRFVFPNQDGLQNGLAPADLWAADIAERLPGFVASTFEELCVLYVRRTYGATAPAVGGWWGPALNRYRRDKSRLSEEIDVAAAARSTLRLVGECKWTSSPMPLSVLTDLREFKLPAIEQEGHLKVPRGGPRVLLFSRSGFARDLEQAADGDPMVQLVDTGALVAGLDAPGAQVL